MIKLSKDLCV